MKKAGWITGIVFFSIISVILFAAIVNELSRDAQTVIVSENGDIVAQVDSGAAILVSAFEGLDDPKVMISQENLTILGMDASIRAYDFNVNDQESFKSLLKIKLPYDAAAIQSGHSAQDCVVAGYYDEYTGRLEPVLYEIDQENDCVIISTNHLSTYVTGAFETREARDAQCNQAIIAGGMVDVIPPPATPNYEDIVSKMNNHQDVSVANSIDLAFSTVNNGYNVSNGLLALSQTVGITGEWIDDIVTSNKPKGVWFDNFCEDFSACGDYLILGQVMVDLAKGNPKVLNDNLMKNLAGYLMGKVNSTVGLATFAIDYSLNELGKVLAEDQQVIVDGYKRYYDAYESEQSESFTVRMYKQVYQIYVDHSIMGHYIIIDIEDEIQRLLLDYCTMIWDEDYVEYFGNVQIRNILNEELEKQISTNAYNELMQSEMQAVFARVQKQLIYDAKIEALKRTNALQEKLNAPYTLSVEEANNFGTDEYTYADCYIQFDAYEKAKEFWTFQLDRYGALKKDFIANDYFLALAPTTAKIYQTQDDLLNGSWFEEVTFSLDETNNEINILLGSNVEYALIVSSETAAVGQTIGLSVAPEVEGNTVVWSISDSDAHYIEHVFGEAGVQTVQADVFDESGQQVAALKKEITVEAAGEITLVSSADTVEVNQDFTFEVHQNGELIATDDIIEWNFGDGFTYSGTANLYDYYYEIPGTYTITATVCDYDGDGNQIVIGSASITIYVQGKTEPAPEPQPDTGASDYDMPSAVGKFVAEDVYHYFNGDEIGYLVYEFYADGTYKSYHIPPSGEISGEQTGTYIVELMFEDPSEGYLIALDGGGGPAAYPQDVSGNQIIGLYNGEYVRE